jgi:flagellar basal-body rod protein FlgG
MPIALFLSNRGESQLANGMWTATSGAIAQSQNLDVIANNLANSDTPSFKKDTPTFKEYLATVERTHEAADIPRGAIKDKDFYPLDGRDESFVVMDGTHTSFRQGNLRVTQGQLDVAMDGPGFLEVSTPAGIRYTRNGSLKLGADGRLLTTEGYPVLAAQAGGVTDSQLAPGQNADVASRFINLKDQGTHFQIALDGNLYSGDNLIAKLSVLEFQDLNKLKKIGGHLFENQDPANTNAPAHTQVRQGVLETSNVNPIEEMTNMIRANRLFEQDLKSIKTYGDLLGKEANEIGKL